MKALGRCRFARGFAGRFTLEFAPRSTAGFAPVFAPTLAGGASSLVTTHMSET